MVGAAAKDGAEGVPKGLLVVWGMGAGTALSLGVSAVALADELLDIVKSSPFFVSFAFIDIA